ncbi:hypothetical protein [Streptomyces sp. NPDC058545]
MLLTQVRVLTYGRPRWNGGDAKLLPATDSGMKHRGKRPLSTGKR